tara:strand:+ start:201 stop:605 length:405 start_codon:yes stop_codon:yes gene_type:complete
MLYSTSAITVQNLNRADNNKSAPPFSPAGSSNTRTVPSHPGATRKRSALPNKFLFAGDARSPALSKQKINNNIVTTRERTNNMNTIKNDATNKYWTHFDDFVETNSMHHDTVADCITTLVRAIDLAKGVATQYV